jgi:hypothetical protein
MSVELDRLIAVYGREAECAATVLALGNAIAHIEKLEAALAECADQSAKYAAFHYRYHGSSIAESRSTGAKTVAKYREMLR